MVNIYNHYVHFCPANLGPHWFTWWLVACSAPSSQIAKAPRWAPYWTHEPCYQGYYAGLFLIDHWEQISMKFESNYKQNKKEFDDVFCKMADKSSGPQCVDVCELTLFAVLLLSNPCFLFGSLCSLESRRPQPRGWSKKYCARFPFKWQISLKGSNWIIAWNGSPVTGCPVQAFDVDDVITHAAQMRSQMTYPWVNARKT